jgi:hypothetical protein
MSVAFSLWSRVPIAIPIAQMNPTPVLPRTTWSALQPLPISARTDSLVPHSTIPSPTMSSTPGRSIRMMARPAALPSPVRTLGAFVCFTCIRLGEVATPLPSLSISPSLSQVLNVERQGGRS